MKKVFQTGTKVFGQGGPRICVPIVEKSREKIWEKAEEIAGLSADLAEWRGDFYEEVFQTEEVLITLKGLKARLRDKALLFTFRTRKEGGNQSITWENYVHLNKAAASGGADLVDVEAFLSEEKSHKLISDIQKAGARVIASNHDFAKTPPAEEMSRRLRRMEELGADVAKLAVMPADRQDVLNLLQVTLAADKTLAIPVVTMSMGKLGLVSRICGGLTGSAMTFASSGAASAPGQIPVKAMEEILRLMSES